MERRTEINKHIPWGPDRSPGMKGAHYEIYRKTVCISSGWNPDAGGLGVWDSWKSTVFHWRICNPAVYNLPDCYCRKRIMAVPADRYRTLRRLLRNLLWIRCYLRWDYTSQELAAQSLKALYLKKIFLYKETKKWYNNWCYVVSVFFGGKVVLREGLVMQEHKAWGSRFRLILLQDNASELFFKRIT